MKRDINFIIIMIALLFVSRVCGDAQKSNEDGNHDPLSSTNKIEKTEVGTKKSISKDKAIVIAKNAVKGKVTINEKGDVLVEEKDKQYVVTFVHKNPPGIRGADFDAKVWVNIETGKVEKILGGS